MTVIRAESLVTPHLICAGVVDAIDFTNVDAFVQRAVEAGAHSLMPSEDMFWGLFLLRLPVRQRRIRMQLFIGTSGFSYQEWKGSFYPADLPAKKMLAFYAEHLPAVEINNTFYRMPGAAMLKGWAEQVPPGFRFVLKAPRKITHSRPLREKEAELGYFLKTTAELGRKLGAILFQMPPYLHKDIKLLSDFADLLPPTSKIAFEFRHRSWFDDDLYGILRDRACAMCCSDSQNRALSRFVATTDWGYLRLRKPNYSETELIDWAGKIGRQNWQAAYVFFKHENAGAGPKLARYFLDLAVRPD